MSGHWNRRCKYAYRNIRKDVNVIYEIITQPQLRTVNSYIKNIKVCRLWRDVCNEDITRKCIDELIKITCMFDTQIKQSILRWKHKFPCIRLHTDISRGECIPLNNLSYVEGIHTLDMFNCIQITDLTPVSTCALHTLDISNCTQITDLTPIIGSNLRNLNMAYCTRINDITPLSTCALHILNISNCTQITDLTPLKECGLHTLIMNDCTRIRDLTPLSGIHTLHMHNHVRRTKFIGLEGVKYVSIYKSVIDDLTGLEGVHTLDIRCCHNITDLTPIKGLHTLYMCECVHITDTSPLEGVKKLIYKCGKKYE